MSGKSTILAIVFILSSFLFISSCGKPTNSDTTPPTATITYPISGSTISGTIVIAVDANDNKGIDKIEFYIDGELKNTASDAPWQYEWTTNPYADGKQHSILAKAYDDAGNTTSSSLVLVTVAPTVSADPFLDTVVTIGSMPKGLTFDTQNNLFISTVSGRIVKLDGNSLSVFIPEGAGGLDFNKHIRFSQGNFYIHNTLNVGTGLDHIDEVLLFDSAGTYISRLIAEDDVDASLFEDITVNNYGQLFVALFGSADEIIARVDANGGDLRTIIRTGDGGVYVATSLATDSQRNLYVGTPSVVSKFDSNGIFRRKIAEEGVSGFEFASNLAVDRNDNLYIGNYISSGDTPTWNILRFDDSGIFQGEFISAGAAGLSAFPEDMGFDVQGRLYVADYLGEADGILRFDRSGNFDRVGAKSFGLSKISSSEKAYKRMEKERHYRELELKDNALATEFGQGGR